MYATSLFSPHSLLKFVKILFSSVVHHEKKITFELQGDRIPSILKGSYTGDVFITNRRVIFFFQSISLSPSLSSSTIVSKGAAFHFKPVWKGRISYARYFLSAFSSHTNSYIGIFNIGFPTPKRIGLPKPLLVSVFSHIR